MKLQEKARKPAEKKFLGVPILDFEKGGREQLIYLLASGLNPNSKVVDLGCGVLRGGYWLIHFLDPGCYFGIEPHTERLEMGINIILEPEVRKAKCPRSVLAGNQEKAFQIPKFLKPKPKTLLQVFWSR